MTLSLEIQEKRRANITASNSHRIMAGWDTPRPTDSFPTEIYDWIEKHKRKPLVGDMKGIVECTGKDITAAYAAYKFDQPTQGLITYAEELACEELFEPDPDAWSGEGNEHIANGIAREAECVRLLSEATGINFVNTGEDQIHLSLNGVGATPDGIAYDELDLISDGCEVKCRSALHHARQLAIRDNASLIEYDFDRFAQIQVQMLVADVNHWYSASYNPLAKEKRHQFHFCKIMRDQNFLNIFQARAELAIKHKDTFLATLLQHGKGKEAA